jgi:hypothetical protein
MQKNNDLNFKRILLIEKLTKKDKKTILFNKLNSMLKDIRASFGIPKKYFGNNNEN